MMSLAGGFLIPRCKKRSREWSIALLLSKQAYCTEIRRATLSRRSLFLLLWPGFALLASSAAGACRQAFGPLYVSACIFSVHSNLAAVWFSGAPGDMVSNRSLMRSSGLALHAGLGTSSNLPARPGSSSAAAQGFVPQASEPKGASPSLGGGLPSNLNEPSRLGQGKTSDPALDPVSQANPEQMLSPQVLAQRRARRTQPAASAIPRRPRAPSPRRPPLCWPLISGRPWALRALEAECIPTPSSQCSRPLVARGERPVSMPLSRTRERSR